ncbi:MAG: hypothetical protein EBT77_01015 [Verrucomicrobia bacterium]|nr:hypothetical protein [Verrucomicrobiota bacterium]
MPLWVPLRKSGKPRLPSTSVASAVGPTAIRSVCGIRLEIGALAALLILFPLSFVLAAPVREDRASAAMYYAEGRRAQYRGDNETALAVYTRALDLDPSSRPYALAKASSLMVLERTTECLGILSAMVSKKEDEAERSTLLCLAYVAEKKMEQAVRAQSEALTALEWWQPEDSTPFLPGKSAREIAVTVLPVFVRVADLDPVLMGVAMRTAEIAFAADDLPSAVRFLGELVEAKPEDIPIREQLAALYFLSQQPEAGRRLLDEVEKEKPGRAELYPVLAKLYEEIKIPARAEVYQTLASHSLSPPDLAGIIRLGLLQLEQNQLRRAAETIQWGLGYYPDSLQLLFMAAMTQKGMNRFAEACTSFSAVERLGQYQPGFLNSSFYMEFASTLEQSGQPLRSEHALRRAIALQPDCHEAMNSLGYLWAERGRNLREARRLIDRALELDPGNPAYLDTLAWILFKSGDIASAEPILAEALGTLPDEPVLLEHYGDILLVLGRNKEAGLQYQRAASQGAPSLFLREKVRKTARLSGGR